MYGTTAGLLFSSLASGLSAWVAVSPGFGFFKIKNQTVMLKIWKAFDIQLFAATSVFSRGAFALNYPSITTYNFWMSGGKAPKWHSIRPYKFVNRR